jgi:hypothetical protein
MTHGVENDSIRHYMLASGTLPPHLQRTQQSRVDRDGVEGCVPWDFYEHGLRHHRREEVNPDLVVLAAPCAMWDLRA